MCTAWSSRVISSNRRVSAAHDGLEIEL